MKSREAFYAFILATAIGFAACKSYDNNICLKYENTPVEKIQKSVNNLKSAQELAQSVYRANGSCPQGAGLIAYLLKDDGYPAKFVKLEKENWGFHWFFMHENKNKMYFADNGLFGIIRCNSVNDLIRRVEKAEGIKARIIEEMPPEFEPKNVGQDIKIISNYIERKDI